MNIPQFAALLLLSAAQASSAAVSSEWRFSVSLDGKSIGYHRFSLSERGNERELRSEARFNVKFLFVNAYSYAHDAKERWHGECLSQLEARTDNNGEQLHVRGALGESKFVIDTDTLTAAVAPCVQTFAYWNPNILSATRLLNPQTGEYVPVRVTHIGIETVEVRGRQVTAERYRIVGDATSREPLQIDLWYSTDRDLGLKQWLALESVAEGGRLLRYQMQ